MPRQLFVNLPVKDLDRSVKFFTALGFSFNPQFTDENATCMIIGEGCYAMLLVEQFFAGFINKPVADASKAAEVINAISVDSRKEVDLMVKQALASGGSASGEAKDYGFMYQHGFQDPDGHLWEVFHMSGEPG
jgi:predicted lactoylglutathione lyase